MLTQLLPGIRELRPALSAGTLWLLLVWMIFDLHDEKPSGPLGEVVELVSDAPFAALLAALAFAAYLVGSASDDLLTPLIVKGFRYLDDEDKRIRVRAAPWLYLQPRKSYHTPDQASVTVESRRDAYDYESAALTAEITRLGLTIDRLEAENALRLALVPPVLALAVYLGVAQSCWWFALLLVVPVLLRQAYLRASALTTADRRRNDLLTEK